jgi:SNF2 family DNA or RNA helicase
MWRPLVGEVGAIRFDTTDADQRLMDLMAQALAIEESQVFKTMSDRELEAYKNPVSKLPSWNHQKRSHHWSRPRAGSYLALEMGCGKTKVAIDLFNEFDARRVLVIAPLYVVIDVWWKDFEKHSIHKWEIVDPIKKIDDRIIKIRRFMDSPVQRVCVVQNYEALDQKRMQELLLGYEWDYIVLDEGHRVMAPGGSRSQFLAKLADHAKRRMICSGTPMPNGPDNFYAQARFLDKGLFGASFAIYKSKWLIIDQFGRCRGVQYDRKKEFEAMIDKIMFRVRSDDVLDLPEKSDVVLHCELEPKAFKIYKSLRDTMAAMVKSGDVYEEDGHLKYKKSDRVATAANGAVKMGMLRQMVGGFIPDVDVSGKRIGETRVSMAKRKLLKEVLTDLGEQPVVVWGLYHTDLNEAQEVCEELKLSSREVSGRTKKTELEEWKNGEAQVLIVQIQAGAEGIDCTRASKAIYFSQSWQPGQRDQSERRVRRPGQKDHVTYYHLIAKGTVDGYVYASLDRKENVIASVLNGIVKDSK